MGKLRYKGYVGSIDYDEEGNYFFGHVLGLRRDGISYEGTSADSLKKDFEESVDYYLENCRANGVEAEKPYSGKLILRITPVLHSLAAEKACEEGLSLNEYISRALQSAITAQA